MAAAITLTVFGVLVAGLWLADIVDLFPAGHPLHKAHETVLGAAIMVSVLFVPTAFTTAVEWLADREAAEVQDLVDDMQERHEQRQLEREAPPATAAGN